MYPRRAFSTEACHSEAIARSMRRNLESLTEDQPLEAIGYLQQAGRGDGATSVSSVLPSLLSFDPWQTVSLHRVCLSQRQEDTELLLWHLNGPNRPTTGPFVYTGTGIPGYFICSEVTTSGNPQEYLHLFWEGHFWVICEGPRESVRQVVYRTAAQNIFDASAEWQLNEAADRRNTDFYAQSWTQGVQTHSSTRRHE